MLRHPAFTLPGCQVCIYLIFTTVTFVKPMITIHIRQACDVLVTNIIIILEIYIYIQYTIYCLRKKRLSHLNNTASYRPIGNQLRVTVSSARCMFPDGHIFERSFYDINNGISPKCSYSGRKKWASCAWHHLGALQIGRVGKARAFSLSTFGGSTCCMMAHRNDAKSLSPAMFIPIYPFCRPCPGYRTALKYPSRLE